MIKKFKIFETLSIWDEFVYKAKTGLIPKDEPDKISEKLSNLLTSGDKVLDISVGYGQYAEYFIKKGFDVYGTDISDLAIKEMKEKYPDYKWLVHNTLDNFPFSENYFDLIFARLALHYFKKEDVGKILLDINRITKDDGLLYIMVKCSKTGNVNTGKISYSQEEWSDMVSECFTILSIKEDIKKAYSFENAPSDILEIIAKKEN